MKFIEITLKIEPEEFVIDNIKSVSKKNRLLKNFRGKEFISRIK